MCPNGSLGEAACRLSSDQISSRSASFPWWRPAHVASCGSVIVGLIFQFHNVHDAAQIRLLACGSMVSPIFICVSVFALVARKNQNTKGDKVPLCRRLVVDCVNPKKHSIQIHVMVRYTERTSIQPMRCPHER